MTFRIQRKNAQKVILAISSIIFAVAIYGILIKNDNLFIIALIFIGILLGGILLSPVFGRFWCGWLCPRGFFLDLTVGSISKNRKIPGVFRSKGLRNLMLVVLILMLGTTLAGMNPFLQLQTANPLAALSGFLVIMCIMTTIAIAVPLGILYKPRTWCGFCPVGYIQSILSGKRLLRLKVEDCVDCMKCRQECPIELNVKDVSSDCFNCMQCADVCNRKSITPVISLE